MAFSTDRAARFEPDLEKAAGHIRYEIDMLLASADLLLNREAISATGILLNMALESFLLHYRNLRAFLSPSIQKYSTDDILAVDFLNGYCDVDFSNPKTFSMDHRRINRMLAHLSYSRDEYVEAGYHRWDIRAMLLPMLAELQQFLDDLAPNCLAWFGDVNLILAIPLRVLHASEQCDDTRLTVGGVGLSAPELEILGALSIADLGPISTRDDDVLNKLVEHGLAVWIGPTGSPLLGESEGTFRITLAGQLLATRHKYRGQQR